MNEKELYKNMKFAKQSYKQRLETFLQKSSLDMMDMVEIELTIRQFASVIVRLKFLDFGKDYSQH